MAGFSCDTVRQTQTCLQESNLGKFVMFFKSSTYLIMNLLPWIELVGYLIIISYAFALCVENFEVLEGTFQIARLCNVNQLGQAGRPANRRLLRYFFSTGIYQYNTSELGGTWDLSYCCSLNMILKRVVAPLTSDSIFETAIKQLRPVQASIRRWPVDCCWNYMLQNLFLF